MKNIIITGSSGSLGVKLTKFFSKKKYNIIAVDNKKIDKKDKLTKVDYYTCDLSNQKSQKLLFNKIKKKYKRIDILLNVAGMIYNSLIIKRTYKNYKFHSYNKWKSVINANLNTSFLTSINCIKLMIENNDSVIINFSSISAKGNIGQIAYSSSKSAIETMTKVMSKELSVLNIRAVSIAPGYFNSQSTKKNMNEKELSKVILRTPSRRIGNVDELVNLVDLVIKNKFINGKTINIDGGLEL